MRLSDGALSAVLFFASGLGAGLLNYLFQVLAGRNLAADDFANLNGWFANLSLFLAVGGFLQYVSNFRPASRSTIRLAIVGLSTFAIGGLWHWVADSDPLSIEKALTLIFFYSAFGWLAGQAQTRFAFRILAASGFLIAVTKLSAVFFPIGTPAELTRYSLALYVAYLPGLVTVAWFLWNAEKRTNPKRPTWLAPAVLSIATVVFPQYDIVILSHTQNDSAFSEFVRATVFSRALYFLIFLFAQWMLPAQIHRRSPGVFKHLPAMAIGSVAFCGLVTILAPFMSELILNWSTPPGALLVFLSSMQMALMAILFLMVQELAAKNMPQRALILTIFLLLEGLIQLTLKLEPIQYLGLAIGFQIGLIAYSWRKAN